MAEKPPDHNGAWYDFPTWFHWHDREGGGGVEPGIDFKTPFHTPAYELFGGTVTSAGYHDWGGEVDVQTVVPGVGAKTESYVHLDYIDPAVTVGSHVSPGQSLGLTGGENPGYPGALHPALPEYSSMPHIEYDLWDGSPWKSPSIDPWPILQNLGGLWQLPSPGAIISGAEGQIGNDLQQGIQGAIQGVWHSVWSGFGVTSGKDLVWRAGFIAVGLVCVIIGLTAMIHGSSGSGSGGNMRAITEQFQASGGGGATTSSGAGVAGSAAGGGAAGAAAGGGAAEDAALAAAAV